MKDGEDHINIYSKGETELGKWLSNFSLTPFKHPYDGQFKSVEGYWYYDLSGDDELRDMYGYRAKKHGQSNIEGEDYTEWQVNKTNIKLAILCKLTQNNPEMLTEFINSNLSFKHYYKYGDKIVEPENGKWLVEFFEDLRKILK